MGVEANNKIILAVVEATKGISDKLESEAWAAVIRRKDATDLSQDQIEMLKQRTNERMTRAYAELTAEIIRAFEEIETAEPPE